LLPASSRLGVRHERGLEIKRLLASLGCATMLLSVASAADSVLSVPDSEWVRSQDGSVEVYRDNRDGRVEIWSDGRATRLLTVTLEGFHSWYSKVYVVGPTPLIVHVRSKVGSLEETGIAIYHQGGPVVRISASQLVDGLAPKPQDLSGVDSIPSPYWFRRELGFTADEFSFESAQGETVAVDLRSGKIRRHR
jgi:hypothetical protein